MSWLMHKIIQLYRYGKCLGNELLGYTILPVILNLTGLLFIMYIRNSDDEKIFCMSESLLFLSAAEIFSYHSNLVKHFNVI
ncbi:hypothetical protein C0J52_13534 [Blattella germanica]|nr:hypothetical protein C0J52_13534 [Blattella germanica]